MSKKPKRKLAVIDYETDPFLYGRIPKPFACGFYELDNYVQFWGDDCVMQLMFFLDSLKDPYVIYAHNGGKFDYFLMIEHLENPLKIINGRISKCALGIHELRDSYSIMPIPLAAYKKDAIDYKLFERDKREANKPAISDYLKSDCVYLFDLVFKFRERFGDKLTVGSTAISELQKFHPFDSQTASHDKTFRPFYFGGRVESFEKGILKRDLKVYDVNSMYPHVMKSMVHPTGREYDYSDSGIMDKKGRISGFVNSPFYFALIECRQWGAFPTRIKGEALNFNIEHGEFYVTSHELKAALDTGRAQQVKIKKVFVPENIISFAEFVDHFAGQKIAAKLSGNKVEELFAKLILNSAYGKFGSNPEHYYDFFLQQEFDDPPENPEFEVYMSHDAGINVWRKPASMMRFFDVATAASITSAARAVLMKGLDKAIGAVYCDTDSIICESLDARLHDSELGAWKLEAQGNEIALCGKKLYALREGKEYVKTASKGAVLTGNEIFDIARGKTIHWQNMAPTFSLSNGVRFVDRKIQSR